MTGAIIRLLVAFSYSWEIFSKFKLKKQIDDKNFADELLADITRDQKSPAQNLLPFRQTPQRL